MECQTGSMYGGLSTGLLYMEVIGMESQTGTM